MQNSLYYVKITYSMRQYLLLILSTSIIFSGNAFAQYNSDVEIVISSPNYSYGDKLDYKIIVSEITGEDAVIFITDTNGNKSQLFSFPIYEQESRVIAPFAFDSIIWREGTYQLELQYSGSISTTEFTIVDDGTIPDARGSLNIDDEGNPTESTVLIENGKLCNYMQDNLNAKLMNTKSTGNGRRESYSSQTIPRMTNTFMLAGEHDQKEIIESVDKGLYAKNFGGGQVDITSGKFVFSASEAYVIEKGKLGKPVKGAMLIGDGPSALHQVSMVGNDLALDPGVGSCGKDGQTVPVNVGQPTMRIEKLTVGGTT